MLFPMKKTALFCICAAGLLFSAGCRKKEAPPVPTLRSEALLEIFRLLDMKNYRAAIPKIERYQELDETNSFLGEMRNTTVSNAVMQDAVKLSAKGDMEGAMKVIEEAISKYGKLDGLVKGREQMQTVFELRNKIVKLKSPCTSDEMALNARELIKSAGRMKSRTIMTFARQKLADSATMRVLEKDYAGFLIYADALDEFDRKNSSEATSLYAILATDRGYYPALERLKSDKVFEYPGQAGKETK